MSPMADHDADTSWAAIARHDVAMATVRRFAEGSGAVRVVVVLDEGGSAAPTTLDCRPGEPMELLRGDELFIVPHEVTAGVEPLAMLSRVSAPPAEALLVDVAEGSVTAPMGALEALAGGVMELARALGGRSVATADFAIAEGGPLTIAARAGEPILLAVGEEQFAMPEGWP